MEEKNIHTDLTSAELANLWSLYLNDSALTCMLTHFLETVEDTDTKPHIEQALMIAYSHIKAVRELFQMEKIAVPHGFPVEQNTLPNAPRLFSDLFYLQFILHVSKVAMASHSASLTMSSRSDVSKLFSTFFDEARTIHFAVKQTLLEKGVYVRPPRIPYPTEVDHVEQESFLNSFLGKKRPLLAIEAAHLYMTTLNNEIGKSLLMGFSQGTKDAELREFYLRGTKISKQIVTSIHEVMGDSNVPLPSTSDSTVTVSTTAPFSDKVMLFMTNALSALGIAMYGTSLSLTARKDVAAMYTHFIARAGSHADDGMTMMIERGWLEQPPQFPDRERLARAGE